MMKRIETILCPVDFSDYSALAVQYAGAFAEHYNARLIVYHCLAERVSNIQNTVFQRTWDRQKYASKDLEKFVKENIASNLAAEYVIGVEEEASSGILDTVRRRKADLIVMGTHGLRGQQPSFTGSVTNKVLHESQVPVLTVCKPIRNFLPSLPDEQLRIRRLLCAVDPNDANMQIINLALSLARSFQSTVRFLEVEAYLGQESSIESLRSIIQPEKENWCEVEFDRRVGSPAEELLIAAESLETDLMILGHHPRRFPELLGSVAFQVIPQAPCPVLVLPVMGIKAATFSKNFAVFKAQEMQGLHE